jgi:hypothetical protein
VTRKVLPLAAVVVLVLLASSADGAHAAKRHELSLFAPDPGHVTVEAVELKVTGKPARKLPRHVRIGFVKRGSLPPSLRVLTVTRAFKSGKGMTYAAAIIAVNRAGAAGARAAADDDEPTLLDLVFDKRRSTCQNCGHTLTPGEYDFNGGFCPCRMRARKVQQATAVNVDAGASSGKLHDLFKADFSRGGDTVQVFGDPQSGKSADPSLDTGHYDDGHAFGWNIKTKPEIIQVEHHVIDDIIEGQQPNIVPELEVAGNVDLNGNGKIDQPGSGQQVTTIVGPPVIT